ncbi:MAG: ABC transporter substrate-binding protein, partial [Candidatus Binataceae bacterium]
MSDKESRIGRRPLLLGAAAAVAASSLGRHAIAAPNVAKRRLIKIGLVAPLSGSLADTYLPIGPFLIDQIKRHLGNSVSIQGTKHPYEIITRDTQSDPNRASEVAQHLIFNDRVDIMTALFSPAVVNPVANQCEANGVPCIATANPLESFYFGRGAPKNGFEWTYDFFFSFNQVDHAVVAEWEHVVTNKTVGIMWPNDADGQGDARTLPPILKKYAYQMVNPGFFDPSTSSFAAQVVKFKAEGVEIVNGIMSPPNFITFWNECSQQRFRPKIVRVAKSTEFFSVVKPLGKRAENLSIEVTWSPAFPYKSGLTGITCPDLARTYTEATHREWSTLLGYPHA